MATEAQIRVNLRNLSRHSFNDGGSAVAIYFVFIRVNSWLNTKIAHFESIYAKQTQFAEYANKRNLFNNNGLCQFTPAQPLQKQSQNKAKQSQFPKSQNVCKLSNNKEL